MYSTTPDRSQRQTRAFPIAILLMLIMTVATMTAATAGARPAANPVWRPELTTARTAGEIHIDGVLGDAGWRTAGRASGFVERSPGENIAPLADTEVWLTYDESNLYVAFLCHDDPAQIRATMCQRDEYSGDDAAGVFIDTYGDGVWAYEFFVNPYGIQKDLMWTSVHGEDRGFDMVWNAAAQVGESGWAVEMAIPLAGMRFPDRERQLWRIDFHRIHPRESYHQYSWSALDPEEQCFPCQWGTVHGISGVRPGRGLEILPSLIGYQTGEIADSRDPDSGIDANDIDGQFSLGGKYSVSSDLTLEGTYNPDFSQIEADADQIDVNTTIQLRFPERRPFFQEGNDLFRTMFNSFYTRMVADPELAAKSTARWDRTSVAYMLARDEHSPYVVPAEERSYVESLGRSTVNVLRGLHSLGNNSQVGAMLTDRRYDDGGSGTILSADANVRLSSLWRWMGQYVHSFTDEPDGVAIHPGATFAGGRHTIDLDGETYSGEAFITELRAHSRAWNLVLDFNQVAPDYRTQTGYDPWNDQRNGFVWTNYNFYTESGLIERITPQLFVDGRWNTDGLRKWRHLSGALDLRLRWAQTYLSLGYQMGEERWGGVDFRDLWSMSLNANARPVDVLGLGGNVRYGENPSLLALERGDEFRLSMFLDLKPVDRLIVEPTLDYIRSDRTGTGELLFRQTIIRARMQLQIDPRLSLRLVVQHNDSESPAYRDLALSDDFPYHMVFGSKWEVDPLVTYRINSFSVFYAGTTHDWRDFNAAYDERGRLNRLTARQYFMKLQYLFQM